MTVTIYHNPACETSRNVLALIRNTGEEPTIVEYLKTPPSRNELVDLIRRMDVPVRDLLRQKGTPYDEFHLGSPDLTDDQLLDAMMAHPSSSTGLSSCRRLVRTMQAVGGGAEPAPQGTRRPVREGGR